MPIGVPRRQTTSATWSTNDRKSTQRRVDKRQRIHHYLPRSGGCAGAYPPYYYLPKVQRFNDAVENATQ